MIYLNLGLLIFLTALLPLLALPATLKVLVFSAIPLIGATLKYLRTWNHTLLILLTLELMMLSIRLVIALSIASSYFPIEILFTYFSFAVVEARVGVAVLVAFSRRFGNENLSLLMLT